MRVATDIGGTFTDIVYIDDNGKVCVNKVELFFRRTADILFNIYCSRFHVCLLMKVLKHNRFCFFVLLTIVIISCDGLLFVTQSLYPKYNGIVLNMND